MKTNAYAVIMAGGEGGRLRCVTGDRPKPLVPLLGRPLMEHILRLLRQHGFTREIPNNCEDCYTVEEFMNDNPEGTFAVKSDGHVACVIDGTLYDSWDSSQNGVIYVWKKGE